MMAKHIVVLASLHASASAFKLAAKDRACDGVRLTFTDFIQEYGRKYTFGSEEYARRQALFSARIQAIGSHNCNPAGPWKADVNHLVDWSEEELKSLMGHKRSKRMQAGSVAVPLQLAARSGPAPKPAFPDSFSWENLSSVQETWDQGNCGSCWAVAAAAVMRSHAEIKGRKPQFATSQFVACTLNPHKCGGTGGCDGATGELAYEYALRAGVVGDTEYREIGGGQTTCPADKQVRSEKTTEAIIEKDGTEVHMLSGDDSNMRGRDIGMMGWKKLPENKEAPLVRALVEHGPVYVAVAAGNGWFSYAGGVLTPQGCDGNNVVNHAVTLYGYGIKPKTRIGDVKYWRIKNSWGEGWGESGSLRLQRLDEEENFCGWDREPQQGSGCEGGPDKVWVCGSCGILYDTVHPVFAD